MQFFCAIIVVLVGCTIAELTVAATVSVVVETTSGVDNDVATASGWLVLARSEIIIFFAC